jgi:protein-S-isoprenylcysteine O-methyltransferase Ste14
MIKFFVSFFTKISEKKYPQWYRVSSLIGTIAFIFLFFPFFYLYTGRFIEDFIQLPIPALIANIIAIPALIFGGVLIVWILVLQYSYGKGSGSHMVPTQKLIVSGPYTISRHPMLLGAILFYFGTGTLLSSITTGLYGATVTAVLAYFFATYIEEPVLIAKFGEQYKKYQAKVPFFPLSFTCPNCCNRKHKSND